MFQQASTWVRSRIINAKELEQEFFTAVMIGDLGLIDELIKKGVNINAIDNHDQTALHMIAEKGDIRVGRHLLNNKRIDINTTTGHGDTPLITAILFNRVQFASFLLHQGANPNIINIFGRTALHFAVKNKSTILVKTLLYFKAQPNVVDEYGNTPLAWSLIEHPSRIIADNLMRWGADPNITSKSQPLLLELALNTQSLEHLKMVKLLIEHNTDVNIRHMISRQTALHMVSITGYVPLAKMLLEHGANSTFKDITGRTAYDMAVQHEQNALISMYKEREKMLKEILKSFSDEKRGSTSIIMRKKRESHARTVRFSELKTKESEHEMFLQNL